MQRINGYAAERPNGSNWPALATNRCGNAVADRDPAYG